MKQVIEDLAMHFCTHADIHLDSLFPLQDIDENDRSIQSQNTECTEYNAAFILLDKSVVDQGPGKKRQAITESG